MKEYIGLQYKMMNRRFKDAGLVPFLAYFILTVGFVVLSMLLFYKTEFATYAYLLFALTLIGKLSESRRTEFLKICFGDAKLKKIRITENLICASPFIVFLLCKQLFLCALLLFLLTFILALVNFRTRFSFSIWTPFSKRPFEYSTGFRNTFYWFFVAYALTSVAIAVSNFYLGIFALLLVFATTFSYYTKPEHEYFVWAYNVSPKAFLWSKIKTAMFFSASLALPIAIALVVFFHQHWGLLSLFFLVGWAFQLCIIVSKYAAYPEEMNISQGVFLALGIWFPPLLVVLIPYLFQQSQNRLSNLLK